MTMSSFDKGAGSQARAASQYRIRVNADDFGLHADINRAIADGVAAGRIQSLSVSANGEAVDWPLLRHLRDRGARIGLHLTWVGEPWLTEQVTFSGWPALAVALARSPGWVARMETEARQQVAVFAAQGFVPAHLDSHQHVHIWPGLWAITCKLARETGSPRIRVPWCPTRRGVRRSPGGVALQGLAAWRRRQVPDSWPCIGLAFSGHYTFERLTAEVRAVKERDLEVVIHPGYATAALRQRYHAWNYDWEAERLTVMAPGWPALLAECGYRND